MTQAGEQIAGELGRALDLLPSTDVVGRDSEPAGGIIILHSRQFYRLEGYLADELLELIARRKPSTA
ncbi:MAG: hypothetical protein IID41_08255 [Planctomycetes bacterium]|nr:hypothetical protein [Planctomycetota bacterium]